MAAYTSFNACMTDIELTAAAAINAANNAYNSGFYKTALNQIRTCLEVICKAIIFYREANDVRAQTTIGNNNLNNLINIIGSRNWFDADAAKNEEWKKRFHVVRDKGNTGSHPGEVKHRDCEDCKVEFRRVLEWFYTTFLPGGAIPADIAAALNNEALTPNVREKKAVLFAYYTYWHERFIQPVFNDEKGMSLDKVYIAPKVRFWEGCLKKDIQKEEENRFLLTPFKAIEQVSMLHEFVPYFLDGRCAELEGLQQPDARLFLLLGYPGQGKTSFCNCLLHDRIVPENLEENALFFVRLRDIADARALFNNPLPVLYEYVVKDIDPNKNYLAQSVFDRAVLVLDGLDELSMRENSGKDEIEEFCKKLMRDQEKYPAMRIILTSRYGYVDLDKFSRHEIIVGELGRLDVRQQLDWLEKYRQFYPDCTLTAEQIKSINDENNRQYQHLRELMDQPILLHLVAMADMDLDDKATRAGIYTKLFDHLIQRAWDKRRQIDALRELKDPQDLRIYIREIAFAIYQSEFEYIRKADLEKLPATEQFMECLGRDDVTAALKYVMIAFYMQDVHKNEDDEDETDKRKFAVEFLHKSLQEYLVAEKIWEDLKSFADKARNKYNIDSAERALEVVWGLFTPNLISQEIQDYLSEHIEADTETDKNMVFERMMKFAPELLERHFLYTLLPKEPMWAGLYAFRGYWVVLAALSTGQNTVPEEKKARAQFIELLKFMTTNSQVIFQLWDLRGADLRGADLNGMILTGANLTGVNLRGAYLSGTDLSITELSGANLRDTNLSGAHLSDANLRGAHLSEAHLRGANLRDTNLSGADLYSVDLRNADLSGADLSGADLMCADLRNAKIEIEQLRTVNSIFQTSGVPEEWVTQLLTEGYEHLFDVPF